MEIISFLLPFFIAFNSIGVEAYIVTDLPDGWAAGYYAADNLMAFRPSVTVENSIRSMVHETVHVIQDCVNGLEEDTLAPIGITVPQEYRTVIDMFYTTEENYTASMSELEYEAYFLEGHPDLVLQLLEEKCTS